MSFRDHDAARLHSKTFHSGSAGRILSVVTVALVILSFLGGGCQRLSKSATNNVAAVSIASGSRGYIGAVTEAIFASHEFKGGRTGPGQFTFQRPGTTMNKLVYGEWIDRKVTVRVVVTVREPSADSTSLTCDARLVSAPGDSVFEEEFKVPKSVRTQCQEMLNEIQMKVNQMTNPGRIDKPAR